MNEYSHSSYEEYKRKVDELTIKQSQLKNVLQIKENALSTTTNELNKQNRIIEQLNEDILHLKQTTEDMKKQIEKQNNEIVELRSEREERAGYRDYSYLQMHTEVYPERCMHQ